MAPPTANGDLMRIRLFGELQIEAGGSQPLRLPTQKSQCLLGFLAYYKGRWHAREHLAEMFWPSTAPESAKQSLRTAISHLRQALSTTCPEEQIPLESDRFRIRLNSETIATDVEDFVALSSKAQTSSPPQQYTLLRQACELHSNPLLSRFYDDWIIAARAELEELLVTDLTGLCKAAVCLGDFTEAIAAAQHLLKIDRYDPGSYLRLIELYRLTNRLDRARAVAQAWDSVARTELNESSNEISTQMFALANQPLAITPTQGATAPPSDTEYLKNVPAVFSRFFGRQDDLNHLVATVDATESSKPILQLVGPAGVGKSRLALEASRRSATYEERRLVWLDLAEISSVSQLIFLLTSTLKLPSELPTGTEQIREMIQKFRLVLLFDGIDRLLEHDSAAFLHLLAEIIPAGSTTALITTARRVFKHDGSHVMRIGPLPVPETQSTGWADNPCVQLVLDRAYADKQGTTSKLPTMEDMRTLTQLCRQLEGLPLSLELAAGWMGCLTPTQIVDRFQNPLDVESAETDMPNHPLATLRSVMAESVELLPADLRDLFINLALFPAGCNLQSLTQVCFAKSGRDSAKQVAALLDRSLVYTEVALDEMRYKQLELVRSYALELLTSSIGLQQRKFRMIEWASQLAAKCAHLINRGDEIEGMNRLLTELPNLEACLQWAFEDGQEVESILSGIQLAINLSAFWQISGSLEAGQKHLNLALEKAVQFGSNVEQVDILTELAELCVRQGDLEIAMESANRAMSLAHGWDRPRREAQCLLTLARAAVKQSRLSEALDFVNQSLTIAKSISDTTMEAQCYNNLGIISYLKSEYDIAHQYYNSALERWREQGVKRGIAACLQNIGLLDWHQGDLFSAQLRYVEAKEAWESTNDITSMAACLLNLGSLECDAKNFERAREWMEQALDLSRRSGDPILIANCLNNLGVVCIELLQHLQAARYLDEATLQYGRVSNTAGVAFCKYNMGLIYYERNDMHRAIELLLHSLEIRNSVGDKRGAVESMELLCAAASSLLPANLIKCLLVTLRLARRMLSMPAVHRRSDVLIELEQKMAREPSQNADEEFVSGMQLSLDEAASLLLSELKSQFSANLSSTH